MGIANNWVGDITIYSKKFLLVLVLFCVCFFSFAQAQETSSDEQISAQTVSSRSVEEQFVFSDSTSNSDQNMQDDSYEETSTVWLFVRLILVLALVVLCIYVFVWFLKKFSKNSAVSDPYLKKVASVSLAPGKSVFIVSTPTQAFVVGSSENSVNLIGEITDKELIDSMNLNASKNETSATASFSKVLASYFPKGFNFGAKKEPKSFDDYFSGAVSETNESLRKNVAEMLSVNKSDGDDQ